MNKGGGGFWYIFFGKCKKYRKNNIKGAQLEVDIQFTCDKENCSRGNQGEKKGKKTDLQGVWHDWRRCSPREQHMHYNEYKGYLLQESGHRVLFRTSSRTFDFFDLKKQS